MSVRLQRRALLKAFLSCVAIAPAFSSIGCASESAMAGLPLTLEDSVRSYFDEREVAAGVFIGQRYLAAVAPNASDEEISALVAPTRELFLSNDGDDDAALAAVHAKVLADFAGEATTLVDGWRFSLTELHLCVLLGLPTP